MPSVDSEKLHFLVTPGGTLKVTVKVKKRRQIYTFFRKSDHKLFELKGNVSNELRQVIEGGQTTVVQMAGCQDYAPKPVNFGFALSDVVR